jgi:membrane associated rhomboid family serine protease
MRLDPAMNEYRTEVNIIGRGVTPAVQWIIAANVVVYLIQLTLLGNAAIAGWLALSSQTFPAHWWTIGTYMFVHAGLMHLALNMLMLWMFGPRIEETFGTRGFTYFYFWCGLGGAVLHLLFVQHGAVVGASGAVVGVVLAYALEWPDEEIYLFGVMPIRARWLAVWMIVWNVGMALADMTGYAQGGTAWMAHVGGLAFAWIALHAPTSSSLDRIRQHVATVPDDDEIHPIPRGRRQRRDTAPPTADEVVARSNAMLKRRTTSVVSAKRSRRHVDEVNRLLDKISREGIDSLSTTERKLLEDMSRGL